MKTLAFLICQFFILAISTHAQIRIVDSGATTNQVNLNETYIQNFDTLASTGSSAPWVNNSTLPGWYSSQSSYSIAFYLGDSNGGVFTSFGSVNSPERSLGSQLDTGFTTAIWGIRFTNDSSTSLSGFSLTYDGEQWNLGGNATARADSLFLAIKFLIQIWEV